MIHMKNMDFLRGKFLQDPYFSSGFTIVELNAPGVTGSYF